MLVSRCECILYYKRRSKSRELVCVWIEGMKACMSVVLSEGLWMDTF